ncbi:hypothetical protein MKK50_22245 [Methylobacterium sp. J-043]|nr:hypothetical protein [Methylobacterium sp. J-043]
MEADYRKLKAEWRAGNRDRENALQLMYFAWMHWADPSFVTGMEDDSDAHELWHAIFDHFGGEEARDPEFLYVATLMASITPWGLGDEVVWYACAARMRDRLVKLKPEGLLPDHFQGRGEYGKYFSHHAHSLSK